jgi:hypothetical protein
LKDLNDEGGSTLVLDSATEEQHILIASKIAKMETKLKEVGYDIDRYKINNKNKVSKKLRDQKKALLSRKTALEKE